LPRERFSFAGIYLNLNRRHLTTGQKSQIGLDLLPLLEKEAKERQRASGVAHSGNLKNQEHRLPTELKESDKKRSRDGEAVTQAAAMVGVSATRLYEMKRIAAMNV
jgi:ABC-type thiamine transport system ATPase subunit